MGIRKRINHKVLGIGGLILLMWVTSGMAKETGQTSSSEVFEQNIHEGFEAKSGFEIVTLERVPTKSRDQSPSAKGLEYRGNITYLTSFLRKENMGSGLGRIWGQRIWGQVLYFDISE